MKKFYKYFCLMHPQYEAIPNQEKNRHLAVIGGSRCHFQGLHYRPHFLCNGTDEVVVATIHDYYQNAANNKSKKLNIQPNYTGIRVQRLTLDSEVLKLQRQLEDNIAAKSAIPKPAAKPAPVLRRLNRKTRLS